MSWVHNTKNFKDFKMVVLQPNIKNIDETRGCYIHLWNLGWQKYSHTVSAYNSSHRVLRCWVTRWGNIQQLSFHVFVDMSLGVASNWECNSPNGVITDTEHRTVVTWMIHHYNTTKTRLQWCNQRETHKVRLCMSLVFKILNRVSHWRWRFK